MHEKDCAVRIDGQAVNGKRNLLADKIPLDTPYTITIFPIYACNFKCTYCIHSLPINKRGDISNNIIMDFELYKKIIDDIAKFPRKLKVLHFIGLGEPLLHPLIAEMVEYAYQKNIADTIDIVTNGQLLTESLSDKLVNAGLGKIRISLQGLNAAMYKEISNVDIDFDKFVKNIKYLFEHRKKTKVYIKIMDVALKANQEDEFMNMFKEISDYMAIEYLYPFVKEIDLKENFQKEEFMCTMNGNQLKNVEICPQVFYHFLINPDGDCIPCCNAEKPITLGNCKKNSIVDIWNCKETQIFRKKQLMKEKNIYKACKECTLYKYGMFAEDCLDDEANSILERCKL